MSKQFQKIKDYFDKGLWSAARVAKAVECGYITQEEYALIVNHD